MDQSAEKRLPSVLPRSMHVLNVVLFFYAVNLTVLDQPCSFTISSGTDESTSRLKLSFLIFSSSRRFLSRAPSTVPCSSSASSRRSRGNFWTLGRLGERLAGPRSNPGTSQKPREHAQEARQEEESSGGGRTSSFDDDDQQES